MANLRKFCTCGDELVARNLTPQQAAAQLEEWRKQHDKPGCYSTTSLAASFARAKKTIDEVTEKKEK